MKKKHALLIYFFFFCFFGALVNRAMAGAIDMHVHVHKFNPEKIIETMDDYSVNYAVFMSFPKVDGDNTFEDASLSLAQRYPDRIGVFYGGSYINKKIYDKDPEQVTKKNKSNFKKQIKAVLNSGSYRGIGELAPLHYSLEESQPEIAFQVDHPYMLVLADLAAEYDIPLDVHMEATTETIPQFKKLLAHNKKAKIIWDHAGWSNTGLATPKQIKSLMAKYSNLYSSIKYRKPDSSEQEAVKLLNDNNKLKSSWKNLFKKYPKRFIIGTDIKFGHGASNYKKMNKIESILSSLSDNVYNKITLDNALDILKL